MEKASVKKEVKKETKPAVKVAAKKEATKEAPKKEATKAAEYGVAYLCEQMGLEPFTIRQKLRKSKTAKNGKTYSWATKKEVEEVIKTLKATKLKNEA